MEKLRLLHLRSKMRSLILTTIIFLALSRAGAQTTVLTGRVMDRELGDPINAAIVEWRAGNLMTQSDDKGFFSLELTGKEVTLRISHLAYQEVRIKITLQQQDTIYKDFFMDFAPVSIPDAVVEDVRKPDTVFASTLRHVADLAILNDKLILLTAEKEDRWKRHDNSSTVSHKNCSLILLDENQEPLDSIAVPEQGIQFYTDYLREVFLITESITYRCSLEQNQLKLQPVDPESFELHIIPALDTLSSVLYYSTFDPDFPAFDYLAHFGEGLSDSVLVHIEDKLQMELLRSEYKYMDTRDKLMAFRMELKTGIDKEIIAAWMTGFSKSLYASPVYAPCFIIKDSICIFDHTASQLLRFDENRNPDTPLQFNYHETQNALKWKRLVHDKGKEDVFSLYQRNGYAYLRRINLSSGQTEEAYRLYFRYPDKVLVHKGVIYYTYRPFESAQKRYLYSENLN